MISCTSLSNSGSFANRWSHALPISSKKSFTALRSRSPFSSSRFSIMIQSNISAVKSFFSASIFSLISTLFFLSRIVSNLFLKRIGRKGKSRFSCLSAIICGVYSCTFITGTVYICSLPSGPSTLQLSASGVFFVLFR